jgi:hypothetical protein
MTNHRMLLSLVLLLASACSSEERRVPPPSPPALPTLASATQTDLGREIDDADRRGTWVEVKRRWQGQQLRWSVIRQAALCKTADACNVAAFPIMRPALHGWMPLLKFAPGEMAKLEAACGTAEQCDFTFEGKLSELNISGEQPTRMTFSDVRIVSTKIAAR